MMVSEVMSGDVYTVPAEATIGQAARSMKTHDVGWLPVTDRGRIVGVVSDRDIVLRALADARPLEETLVATVMTLAAATCRADTSVEDALAVMRQEKVRRLVVVDRENERPVGVVSIGDLFEHGAPGRLACEALAAICRSP